MSAVITDIMKFQTKLGLDKQEFNWENESVNIFEELLEAKGFDVPKKERTWLMGRVRVLRVAASTNIKLTWKHVTDYDMVDAFGDIIVFCVGAIMKLKFCPICVLEEVGKEINSREGKIINGKFEKFTEKKYTDKHYKADFSQCRL